MRLFERTLWASVWLAAGLTGCSPGPIIDRIPADIMGLPANAPARPETPYDYPAVHDMPPDRASVPMTDEEQLRLEKDLASERDRQEGRPPSGKKASSTAKKPLKDTENGQTAGAKPNP
jgi:hypothetical protein